MGPRRGANFSTDEDLQLCKSWLAISQDPLIANNQSGASFWKRVHDDFAQHSPHVPRTVASLEGRWGPMNRSIAKYCGCVEQVKGYKQSGKNVKSLQADSHALYLKLEKHEFKFVQCYNILSSAPKWTEYSSDLSLRSRRSSKRPSSSCPTASESQSDTESTFERPVGQKKAKKMNQTVNLQSEGLAQKRSIAESSSILAKEAVLQRRCLQTLSDDTILRAITSNLDHDTQELYRLHKEVIKKKLCAQLEWEAAE